MSIFGSGPAEPHFTDNPIDLLFSPNLSLPSTQHHPLLKMVTEQSNPDGHVETAAEKFWNIFELRHELFLWEHNVRDLVAWLTLEKRSLIEVSMPLYKTIPMMGWKLKNMLLENGCSSVSQMNTLANRS